MFDLQTGTMDAYRLTMRIDLVQSVPAVEAAANLDLESTSSVTRNGFHQIEQARAQPGGEGLRRDAPPVGKRPSRPRRRPGTSYSRGAPLRRTTYSPSQTAPGPAPPATPANSPSSTRAAPKTWGNVLGRTRSYWLQHGQLPLRRARVRITPDEVSP